MRNTYCSACRRQFRNKRGLHIHNGHMHDKPEKYWMSPEFHRLLKALVRRMKASV